MRNFCLICLLAIAVAGLPGRAAGAGLQRQIEAAEKLEFSGRFAAAIERYQRIEPRYGSEVGWRIVRALTDYADSLERPSQRRALLEQARRVADRALAAEPRAPRLLCAKAVALGKLALLSGKTSQVRLGREVHALASRAVALDPELVHGHIILGAYNREVAAMNAMQKAGALLFGGLPEGTIQRSLDHLEKALAIDPDNLRARFEYALTMKALDKPRAAERELVAVLDERAPSAGDRLMQRRASDQLARLRRGER